MVPTIKKEKFTYLIRNFRFPELFNELGWDSINKKETILINDEIYSLEAVAEKRGFIIFVCSSGKNGKIPDKATLRKIDHRITKLYFEHLIIYTDKNSTHQIWQFAIREPNKPIIVRNYEYFKTQEPELLFQKLSGLFFSIDDEENISLVDVKSRVLEQFNTNAEKVTKQFYSKFRDELLKFQKFIKGIENTVDKEWYASLMLNRLMFIYFIQKKGFLDKNRNYLFDKLKESKKKNGDDKFFSFYQNFLLVLFHKGLGSTVRTKKIIDELGIIPYLNGGLFEEHDLEKKNDIEIPDSAFERIFKFFDEYNWHLDTSITASGKDINPDVIGYIFEKYINDRASMGAYYTKEDITEYISKNTIIPFLFDAVKKECANAFREESSLWKLLCENPDRYIYEALKKGVYDDNGKVRKLPNEIEIGIHTTKPDLLKRRKEWNKPASEEFALPTEIWREVVERRTRYFDIKNKLVNGEIKEINDFITYNLDIRQFAQDAVEQYEGSDFINAFYKAIFKITILDPTCGSGAFLFAALNILEPLYESCIGRMREFVEVDNKASGRKFGQFRQILQDIENHPNQEYYIYKRIILNNLYGVDIMREAVEIAKLRLFLKLVAEVEPDYNKENFGLEPLPDIDFNIRAGNTLIGFTSHKEIQDVYEECEASGRLMFADEKKLLKKIEDLALIVSKLFKEFKEKQAIIETDSESIKKIKKEFEKRLKELNDLLNKYKAYEYGIDSDDLLQQKKYNIWLTTHKPFHWYAEYYEIMDANGFDVVIGNPPFIEYSKIRKEYTLLNYETITAGNLYAMIIERAVKLMQHNSRIGMIKQLSAYCTPRMINYQELWFKNIESSHLLFFDDRPGKLFDNLEHIRIAISLGTKGCKEDDIATTNYIKFYSEYRSFVFQSITFIKSKNSRKTSSVLKIKDRIEHGIVSKVWKSKSTLSYYLTEKENRNFVYYGYGYGYFGKILNFKSYFKGELVKYSTGDKYIFVNNDKDKDVIVGLLNSSLFYWFYVNFSDGHNFTKYVIGSIPFTYPNHRIVCNLKRLVQKLMTDLEKKTLRKEAFYKSTGKVIYQEFYPKLSKDLIDRIDEELGVHYRFTEEELDYIINFDIKYRMGREIGEGNELE